MAFTLAEIAEKLQLTIEGDGEQVIESIAPLHLAQAQQISFIVDKKYRKQLADCAASALIIPPAMASLYTGNKLISDNPYVSYAQLAQLMDTTPDCAQGIHPSAVIDPSAIIGEGVAIAANAVIEAGVELGDNAQIGANCFIGQFAKIGAGTKLWANVSVYHGVEIGDNCLIQSATVIGCDGFGYANQRGQWVKIPQLGRVVIGNNTEIGASVTIDRGALTDTKIASNVIIDNQVHIAHNVEIGTGTAIAGASGIAGSTRVGNYCIIGGSVSINGHIEICDQVNITGDSMVVKSITEAGTYSSGIPAQDNRSWRKMTSRLFRADEVYKRLQTLEKSFSDFTKKD